MLDKKINFELTIVDDKQDLFDYELPEKNKIELYNIFKLTNKLLSNNEYFDIISDFYISDFYIINSYIINSEIHFDVYEVLLNLNNIEYFTKYYNFNIGEIIVKFNTLLKCKNDCKVVGFRIFSNDNKINIMKFVNPKYICISDIINLDYDIMTQIK